MANGVFLMTKWRLRRRYLAYSIAEVNIHRLTSYRATEKRPDNLGRISCLCKNLLKLDQHAKTLKPWQGYELLKPCPNAHAVEDP